MGDLTTRPDSPPEMASRLGHCVVWDPPFLTAGERWTCSNCGHAVLRYGRNVYGSAIEQECSG